jgi:hypothetical protein
MRGRRPPEENPKNIVTRGPSLSSAKEAVGEIPGAELHRIVGSIRAMSHLARSLMSRDERMAQTNPWKAMNEALNQLYREGFTPMLGPEESLQDALVDIKAPGVVEQINRHIGENGPGSVVLVGVPLDGILDTSKPLEIIRVKHLHGLRQGAAIDFRGTISTLSDFMQNDGTLREESQIILRGNAIPSLRYDTGLLWFKTHSTDGPGTGQYPELRWAAAA